MVGDPCLHFPSGIHCHQKSIVIDNSLIYEELSNAWRRELKLPDWQGTAVFLRDSSAPNLGNANIGGSGITAQTNRDIREIERTKDAAGLAFYVTMNATTSSKFLFHTGQEKIRMR